MLQVTSNSTIYLASKHIDFRKGIDGIVSICRNIINVEPLDGAIFVFYNRHMTSLKILNYDGQGFWLCTKRLSRGSFIWKSQLNKHDCNNHNATTICYRILHVLINNGNLDVTFASNWRNLK